MRLHYCRARYLAHGGSLVPPRRGAAAVPEPRRSGIFYSDGECQGHLPVLGSPVVNVTGGGDAFMAGLAHAWLQESDMTDTTRFALGCAALTVNCSDTVFSGLSKAAVERMLEEYPC